MHEALEMLAVLALLASGCSSNGSDQGCNAGDQDGVFGGSSVVLLNVSDVGFAVGGLDSGSMQPNIAAQNSSNVTLTLSNVGSRSHDLNVQCIPSGAPSGCPAMACFPSSANIPALDPGKNVTVTFKTPAVEGAYRFSSEQPGDSDANGGTGLVGEFVLM